VDTNGNRSEGKQAAAAIPADITPPAEVAVLGVDSGVWKETLTWTDPGDGDFDHVEISWTPTTAQTQPVTLTKGTGTREISGLTPGQVYAFLVRTADGSGNRSAGKQAAVAIPTDITPPAEVAWLTATVSGKRVRLSWTDPTDADFDHVEISYSANSGTIRTLPLVAKTKQQETIGPLSYGTIYAFTVKTVDTSGNKSRGALVLASLDKVVSDLDLIPYITAPVANSAPNTRSIDTVQYTGTVAWRNGSNNSFSGNFAVNVSYTAKVTLTANPGYTFQGVAKDSFTYAGATGVDHDANSGLITIAFPAATQGWYVSDEIGQDNTTGGRDGSSLAKSFKSVAYTLESIHTAYIKTSPSWPGKSATNPVRAVIVIFGDISLGAQIDIDDKKSSSSDYYPPIVLRGLGPDNPGTITAHMGDRILNITGGAQVTMGDNLILTGNATGPSANTDPGGGGVVRINTNSAFTMSGGLITNGKSGYCGGGVYGLADSVFVMTGGTITKNDAQRGCGVATRGTFTMTGGTIAENGNLDTTISGGGVYIFHSNTTPTTSTMSGGIITGNMAQSGGGITLEGHNPTPVYFIMNGGTITKNIALVTGGLRGIYAAYFTLNEGTISYNEARGTYAGGVAVTYFTMNGGSILHNTAATNGGGVGSTGFYPEFPTFTMTGGIIAENQAGEYGGGVYIMDGGVFKKEPLTTGGSSGVIYGYDSANPGSNKVLGLGIEVDHGHAVYIENGPKKRETTVSPDQTLDSTVSDSWAD
jgi:hypothetical protein